MVDTMKPMLRLLVDTSTWLDLSRRRDGQRWIVALRVLVQQGNLELLVPSLVIDEFERNRARVEASMTTSVADRFKHIRQDLDDFGGTEEELKAIGDLARDVPLIGAMATRNFDDVLELLQRGRTVSVSNREHQAVVERGLTKRAPFHRARNSVADALLIELYATAIANSDCPDIAHAFVTSNSADFSATHGDKRQPHQDISVLFDVSNSTYALGVDGLSKLLDDHFGPEIEELFVETSFVDEPRRLEEIQDAEQEFFDRIWYHRSLQAEYKLARADETIELERLRQISGPGRQNVEMKYTGPDDLGPYSDFELGMLNGKLSALRWVLGSEWDFLDT